MRLLEQYLFDFKTEISKLGLTTQQYENCLKDISNKVTGLIDLDWSDIIDKYNLPIAKDTLRKSSSPTPFGSVFVVEYLKQKGLVDNASETQIQNLKNVLGEQFVLKRQIQEEKTNLNRIKRDFVRSIAVAEEIKDYLESIAFHIDIPDYCHSPILLSNSKHTMIVCISDWHIGYKIIDCKGNSYNWEIANERVNKFIDECYKYIDLYGIEKVYVYNLGDTIESTYMRKNQSQYCEFSQGEQIAKATQLIYRFLVALCKKCYVQYDGIPGNHDRFAGDKSENLDGDNANAVITPMLANFIELSGNKRIHVVNRSPFDSEISPVINGISCKFVHGDKNTKNDRQKISGQISMDGEFYDLYFEGYWHNFRCISENRGRYLVTSGCLSGWNDYSTSFNCATVASQTIAVIGDKKIELIKDVQLN